MSKAPPFMVLLMRAIKARDFAAASRLIESEVEQRGDSDWLWQRDRYGRTVFSIAGGAGIRDALDLFRPYGIRWDAWSAATWGEVPQLEAIARQPSPPWSETLCYGTPLHWALMGGHEAAVRYLIFDVGIDVAATDDGYVRSAVCGRNAEHLVPLLIEQGADVDWDASADTALQHQCNHGRTSHVALLIAHGADVNRPRKRDGRTSLHCAAATGIAGKLVRMLLDASARRTPTPRIKPALGRSIWRGAPSGRPQRVCCVRRGDLGGEAPVGDGRRRPRRLDLRPGRDPSRCVTGCQVDGLEVINPFRELIDGASCFGAEAGRDHRTAARRAARAVPR